MMSEVQETSGVQDAARVALGLGLMFAGVSHLTFAREEFKAQVPEFVPLDVDTTVLASGAVEIALGAAIASGVEKKVVGAVAAAFFVAVFPGNLAQWYHRRSAFGLDTDGKRVARLFGQPGLVALALWSTGAGKP